MHSRHWSDALPCQHDSGLIHYPLFSSKQGGREDGSLGCLSHLHEFSRRCLPSKSTTGPLGGSGLTESWFVASGRGKLWFNHEEHDIYPGVGFVVPFGSVASLVNENSDTLELIVVSEKQDEKLGNHNHVLLNDPCLRDYLDSPEGTAHWTHRYREIHNDSHGLNVIDSTLVVEIPPMSPSEMHAHGTEQDEIWYMWRGKGIHVVDREMCIQEPGTAMCVTPCEEGHMLTNHTTEPLFAYYVRGSLQNGD